MNFAPLIWDHGSANDEYCRQGFPEVLRQCNMTLVIDYYYYYQLFLISNLLLGLSFSEGFEKKIPD